VNEILATDPSNAVRLLSGTPVGDKSLLDEVNFDVELKPTESNVIKKVGVNENDSDGKTNKIKESSKKEVDRIKDVREGTVKAIKERLALVLYREIKDGNNTCTIHSLMKSVHYKNDTGDTSNILQQCLLYGYEDERILNRRISQSFLDIQYAISQDEGVTLDKLSHSRKDQQHIPLDLLDEMLSEIPIYGKMIIIGDPSGLHSLRAIECGWKPEDITVWENDPCHVYAVKQVNNKITILKDYETTLKPLEDILMKFDAVLTNPPYQSNDGNGELKGSGTGALWWKITQVSKKLVKEDGWLSFVTPTNILSGGDQYTSFILGEKRKLDLQKVVTSVNKPHFTNVQTKICRWVARNRVTKNNTAIVNNSLEINSDKTVKIYNDVKVQKIIETLVDSKENKFDISVRDTADPRAVSRMVQRDMGMSKVDADKYVRDYSEVQSDEYPYAINSNGNIKYGKVKWITYGRWKMMIPIMKSPFKYEIIVSDTIICDQGCDVQYFNSREDALKTKEILDDPLYRWVIEQTRMGGRLVPAILTRFPNVSITKVLTSDQISYIESQL